VLELDGLVRRFGDTVALDGLSFTVPAGEVFGFLGPNGSGKSTAMRAVLKLTALESGEVRWDGRRYGFDQCRRIGYMPEERGLYPRMRIAEQVRYFGELHGMSKADATAATARWLQHLGLAGRAHERVEALSLGNQQRVQLATALVHEPPLLVLDEPFSGLDPVGIDDLAAVLTARARDGATVIFSSHQLDLVEHLCDSVAIVNRGRCVATGRVRDLAAGGTRRLVVAVAGDPDGSWAGDLPGVTVTRNDGGVLHLELVDGTDPQDVLRRAMRAGAVTRFGTELRRLSEVFREAVGEPVPAEEPA
jgi:ABC-2 type transport system ATP-binding protein